MTAEPLYTYLDTTALMRRAEAAAEFPTARNKLIDSVLVDIFDDERRRFGCSELTLLEFHTNVTTNLRSDISQFDHEWWERAVAVVMSDLASGRIQVLEAPPKAAEHVMSLVTVATGKRKRALRAWDAMHAVVAARWAEDIDHSVEILTSDSDFAVALEVMSGLGRLHVVNLDVLAQTGEGADRARATALAVQEQNSV